MARFFVKSGSNEKVTESPPPDQEVVNLGDEADEDHDDLHRGMKPRQLSPCSGPLEATGPAHTDWMQT